MSLEMVFNELSLQNSADDIQAARQLMDSFIQTIRVATKHGISKILRTHEGFFASLLAPDYPLARWLNDHEVEREEKQYIKSLTTKSPFLIGLESLQETDWAYEFRFDSHIALGLGYAFRLETLAISFFSNQCWDSPHLSLEYAHLDESENLATHQTTVVHACRKEHIETHKEWFENRIKTSVQDGADLWSRRESLFPSLSFCDEVQTQITVLNSGSPWLRPIVKRLFELESYCKEWDSDFFQADLLPSKASNESQSTLQQYGNERTFLCPDGEERIFSWHVRLTPGAWRLHFFPDADNKKILVGYIGPHLPTVSDPT
jgi:hypothetical protein